MKIKPWMRALPDSSPSFRNGFALGLIVSAINDGYPEITCPVHISNMESLSITAAGNEYALRFEECGPEVTATDYLLAVLTKT